MIKAFLSANALPLHDDMPIMFGWFARDLEDNDEVGCPCFVYEYGRYVSGHIRSNNIIVYVKIFANRDLNITKFYQVTANKKMFFDELKDGDMFEMKDKFHRYQDQRFIYQDGKISEC